MLIVGGLALTAFVEASTTFNKDKKSIDSSQNLSAVLEMIGNDIKQSGELISDISFPSIEFAPNTDTGSMSGSSKITIRRSVSDALTLCQNIPAGTDPATLTSLLVSDSTATTVSASTNCDVATTTNPLFVIRPATRSSVTVNPTDPATTYPTTTRLALTLPPALRKARDYRCKLDEPNPTVPYDSTTRVTDDFCDSVTSEKLRIAVSDENGHMLIFNQTNETADAANGLDTVVNRKRYSITLQTSGSIDYAKGFDQKTIDNNTKNKAVAYGIGKPIYILEERVYTLTSGGEFQVSVNGQAPLTLIKKIDHFRASARIYNATDRNVNPSPASNPIPASDICTNTAPFLDQPTIGTAENPKYICKFNYNGSVVDDDVNWKLLAGIKVEIHAKYDATGRSANPTAEDAEKLKAMAEYFPRNVLSK